ncbi:MAG: transporter, family, multidrug resistance protein [Actinomycetota bacterium]|nr:transporter, family, multidrug resistance protein [Actinomycetota bacterium]
MSADTSVSTTGETSAAAVVFVGLLSGVQASDPNIAATALVSASRGLQMTSGQTSIAASIFTIMMAATVISTGLLADRLGRRRVLLAALALSVVGDVVVALAPGFTIYAIGRGLAGVGLGAVYGAAFAYVNVLARPGRLAAAVGVFTAAGAVAMVGMSFVGGILTSQNWRLAFLLVPAVSLLGMLFVPKLLPEQSPVDQGKSDVLGQLLLGFGVIGTLYGLSHAAAGVTKPLTWIPLLVGILLLVAFFLSQRYRSNAFYPVRLFRNPVFIGALCAGFVYNFGQSASFLQLANIWQYIGEFGALQVTLAQLPYLATGIIGALLVGRWMSNGLANANAVLLGTALTALGFFSLLLVHRGGSFWTFLPALLLIGAGTVIASLPFGSLIIGTAPAEYYGPVTSSRTTIGQFAYAIGIAAATLSIDKLTLGGTVERLTAAGVPPSQVGTGLDAVTAFGSTGTHPSTELGRQALSQANTSYHEAFHITMVGAGLVCLLVGFVGYWLLRRSTAAN